ncbi:MAG: hypothetical protein C5B51_27595 [Terriglobia bacterium]|nr:MAG: hypothetical protein C5B51_27595 [Terriglobia bacterium]
MTQSGANRILVCALAVLLFSAVSAWGLLGSSKHISLLLAVEYLLLLPAALYGLRAGSPAVASGLPDIPRVLPIAAFLAAALALSWLSNQGLLIPDESAYQFQARTFALGEFAAPAPPGAPARVEGTPLPLYFEHHIFHQGRWFTKYPPGWPMLLALPLRLGIGWIVNPLLGLAVLLITAAIARRVFDNSTAACAVVLAVLSPFFLANCIGRMSHPACAAMLAGACLFCFAGLRSRRLAHFAGMMALILAAVQVRPFTAAVVGGVLGLSALWYLRQERLFAGVLLLGAFFGALSVGSMLAYNKLYTGNYRLSPYTLFNQNPLTRSGNVADIDLQPSHMIDQFFHQTRWALQDTVYYTFAFIFLMAGYSVWREKKNPREVRILAALFPALVVAHVVQPALNSEFIGERYYFEAYFAVAILAARGLSLLVGEWRISRQTLAVVLGLFAAFEGGQMALAAPIFLEKTGPYRQVREAAEQLSGKRYAVFLQTMEPQIVAKHFNLNRPDWQQRDLFYLVDPGPFGRAEWACRVGRPDWVVIGYDPANQRATRQFGRAAMCP